MTPRPYRDQPDELYFDLGLGCPSFPAVIGHHATDGHPCPAFRRSVADTLVTWISQQYCADGNTELGRAHVDSNAITLVDRHGNESRVLPNVYGRYALDAEHWKWAISIPTPDVAAEEALLADASRLVAEPGEEFVALVTGSPPFPALVSQEHGNGLVRAHFRRPVAEVIVASTNDSFRFFPNGQDQAYWHGDTIIHIAHDDTITSDYRPIVISAGADGRYCIDRWEWVRHTAEDPA